MRLRIRYRRQSDVVRMAYTTRPAPNGSPAQAKRQETFYARRRLVLLPAMPRTHLRPDTGPFFRPSTNCKRRSSLMYSGISNRIRFGPYLLLLLLLAPAVIA